MVHSAVEIWFQPKGEDNRGWVKEKPWKAKKEEQDRQSRVVPRSCCGTWKRRHALWAMWATDSRLWGILRAHQHRSHGDLQHLRHGLCSRVLSARASIPSARWAPPAPRRPTAQSAAPGALHSKPGIDAHRGGQWRGWCGCPPVAGSFSNELGAQSRGLLPNTQA